MASVLSCSQLLWPLVPDDCMFTHSAASVVRTLCPTTQMESLVQKARISPASIKFLIGRGVATELPVAVLSSFRKNTKALHAWIFKAHQQLGLRGPRTMYACGVSNHLWEKTCLHHTTAARSDVHTAYVVTNFSFLFEGT